MEIRELINECVKEKGIAKATLAKNVGMTSQNLYNKLARPNGMRIDSLVAIMEALGYDVIVKDRETGKEMKVKI